MFDKYSTIVVKENNVIYSFVLNKYLAEKFLRKMIKKGNVILNNFFDEIQL